MEIDDHIVVCEIRVTSQIVGLWWSMEGRELAFVGNEEWTLNTPTGELPSYRVVSLPFGGCVSIGIPEPVQMHASGFQAAIPLRHRYGFRPLFEMLKVELRALLIITNPKVQAL
jgi:hypothetical protein